MKTKCGIAAAVLGLCALIGTSFGQPDISNNDGACTSDAQDTWTDVIVDDVEIIGCPDLANIDGYSVVETIQGHAFLNTLDALESLNGFNSVTEIAEAIHIQKNPNQTSLNGFNAVEIVGGNFAITAMPKLETIAGFNSLKSVSGYIYIGREVAPPQGGTNSVLRSIHGFQSLTHFGDGSNGLFILDCPELTPERLENLFPNLQCIHGSVTCENCSNRIKNLASGTACESSYTLNPTTAPTIAPTTPTTATTEPPMSDRIDTSAPTDGDTSAPTDGESSVSKTGMSKTGMSKTGMSKTGMSKTGMSKTGMSKAGKNERKTNEITKLGLSASTNEPNSISIASGLVGAAVLVAVVAYRRRQQKKAGYSIVKHNTVQIPSETTSLV